MPAIDGPVHQAAEKKKTPTKAPKQAGRPRKLGPGKEDGHRCMICGTIFGGQSGYFPKIQTKMYKVNNYYALYCNYCCAKAYEDWLKQYGSEARAIRRCCEWLNVYFDPTGVGQKDDGFLGYLKYMGDSYFGFSSKSWDDTIADEADAADEDDGALYDMSRSNKPNIKEGVEVFGEGFPPDAYPMMLRTYHEYLDPLGDTVTATQKKSARFLSSLEYRCMEAIKTDKPNASALSSSLTKAIKESGFDTVQATNSVADEDTFGQWLERIQMYTPAQYVKQTPYKDVDNYDRYYDRFVRRPVENLLSRASQMQTDDLTITEEEVDAVDMGDGDDEA